MKDKCVLLYQGGLSLVGESGVGCAERHQERALTEAGVNFKTRGWDADVVHFNTVLPDSALMALRAKRDGKCVVYHAHSTKEDFRNSFLGSNLLAPLFKRWITFCYNLGDVIVTPTPYSRRLLSTYGLRAPIVAVSNGVDTEFFKKEPEQRRRFRKKYHLAEEKKVVLSVGLPIERKGILDFIRAAEVFPEYEFFWFGWCHPLLMPRKIKKAMEQAPANCHFPGFVGKEELRDAYGGADCFLFLSTEETEGIVLLEALSMELPIVARKIGAYEGWLTDGENARLEEDFRELRRMLRRTVNGEIPTLTENGRRTAMERDLKSVGHMLARIYQSLYNGEENKAAVRYEGERVMDHA